MSLRDSWEFKFDVADVATGARLRMQFHIGRVAYWQEQYALAEADLRANGINLREAVAMNSRTSAANAYGHQAMIDNDKLQKVTEAELKIHEHERHAKDLSRWIYTLSQAGPEPLSLTITDVEYFWLARVDHVKFSSPVLDSAHMESSDTLE